MIDKDHLKNFSFQQHRKTTLTKISRESVPVGTEIRTISGVVKTTVSCRIAIDNDGYPYPLDDSLLLSTYELASD